MIKRPLSVTSALKFDFFFLHSQCFLPPSSTLPPQTSTATDLWQHTALVRQAGFSRQQKAALNAWFHYFARLCISGRQHNGTTVGRKKKEKKWARALWSFGKRPDRRISFTFQFERFGCFLKKEKGKRRKPSGRHTREHTVCLVHY